MTSLWCVVFVLPPAAKVSAHLIGLRRSLMQWTDQRVGLMNEVINSMQMIKFMAWEGPFKVRMATSNGCTLGTVPEGRPLPVVC